MRACRGVWIPVTFCLGGWACGTAEVGSPSGNGLSIVDTAPPPAMAAEPYSHALRVLHASPAVHWSLPERATELDWLSVDPLSGLLRGIPSTVVAAPAAFRVRATDGALSAERSFSLTVTCRDGAHLPCSLALGETCHAGVAVCSSGRLGACGDTGLPSADRRRCGPGCAQACDDLLANRCDGSCVCGDTGGACGPATQCCGEGASGTCVDTQRDNAHCGTCQTDCWATVGARQHVAPTCGAGVCTYGCLPPYGDCNADEADGCETDTATAIDHCGACGRACLSGAGQAGVAATCSSGECLHPCLAGRRNCSPGAPSPLFGEDADGCETTLGTVTSCQSCGDVCATPLDGAPVCGPSGCAVACDPGYSACGLACVDLALDRNHCGSCSKACTPGTFCMDGTCCPPAGC